MVSAGRTLRHEDHEGSQGRIPIIQVFLRVDTVFLRKLLAWMATMASVYWTVMKLRVLHTFVKWTWLRRCNHDDRNEENASGDLHNGALLRWSTTTTTNFVNRTNVYVQLLNKSSAAYLPKRHPKLTWSPGVSVYMMYVKNTLSLYLKRVYAK